MTKRFNYMREIDEHAGWQVKYDDFDLWAAKAVGFVTGILTSLLAGGLYHVYY